MAGAATGGWQDRARRWLADWAVALLFGLLVYVAIESFVPGTPVYNRQVAGQAVVLVAALMLWLLRSGTRLRVGRDVALVGAALLLAMAASTLGSPARSMAIDRLHLYYAVALLGVCLYLLLRGGSAVRTESCLLVVALVHAVFLVSVVAWLHWAQAEYGNVRGRVPHYANVRHLGYHGFLAAACGASLFLCSRRFAVSAFVLTTMALFGVILFGSRGALYSWLAFAAVAAILTRSRLRFIAFCACALLLAGAAAYGAASVMALPEKDMFSRVESGVTEVFQTSERTLLWRDAAAAFWQRPWLGFGAEGHIVSRCCNPRNVQPHNAVLQLLIEFGVVGSVLLLALSWRLLRQFGGWRTWVERIRHHQEVQLLSAVLAGFAAYSMIDGLTYHAIPLLHLALLAALLFAAMDRAAPRSPVA